MESTEATEFKVDVRKNRVRADVQVVTAKEMVQTFVRLTTGPFLGEIRSWSLNSSDADVTVDEDEDGNVVGVTVTRFTPDN